LGYQSGQRVQRRGSGHSYQRGFRLLADKPDDWIYVNLGLLIVRATLPKVASLASAEDLAKVEEGIAVACFGFTHEGEKNHAI